MQALVDGRRPLSLQTRPTFWPIGSDQPTRLTANFKDDSYGWCSGPPEAGERDSNYQPLSNFHLFFRGFVPTHPGPTPSQPRGGVETLVKMSDREFSLVLDIGTLHNKDAVLAQISTESGRMLIANGLNDKDWVKLVDLGMAPLHLEYDMNPQDKIPVTVIGPQVHLWPQRLIDFQPCHLYYFYNTHQGVLDAMGNKAENSKVVFDKAQMRGACQINYNESHKAGFALHFEDPIARGEGPDYFEGILRSLLPALFGLGSSFNIHFLKKNPVLVLEGAANLGKTASARLNLSVGSTQEAFLSGSTSSAPAIQLLLGSFAELCILDDLEGRSKENRLVLGDYEGAATHTISHGATKRLAPLLITSNPNKTAREEKYVTGRTVVLKCTKRVYEEPAAAVTHLNDLIGMNQTQDSLDKPLTFLIGEYFKLYFDPVRIPASAELLANEGELPNISKDGKTTCKYIKLLAETCQEVKELTGKDWREVIGQSLLFMWAKAIDLIMHGEDSKWFDQGGSEAFFKDFLPKYLAECYDQPDVINTESQQDEENDMLSFMTNFLGPVLTTLQTRFDCQNQDTTWPDRLHYPEWPGDEVKEVRLVDSRKSKTAVFLWFTSTGLKEFKSSYGNHKHATCFVPLLQQNDGGVRSVRFYPGDVMHRGFCINVKHLPSGLVKRLFSLLVREDILPLLTGFGKQLDMEENGVRTEQAAILDEIQEHGQAMSMPGTLEEDVDMEDMGDQNTLSHPVETQSQPMPPASTVRKGRGEKKKADAKMGDGGEGNDQAGKRKRAAAPLFSKDKAFF